MERTLRGVEGPQEWVGQDGSAWAAERGRRQQGRARGAATRRPRWRGRNGPAGCPACPKAAGSPPQNPHTPTPRHTHMKASKGCVERSFSSITAQGSTSPAPLRAYRPSHAASPARLSRVMDCVSASAGVGGEAGSEARDSGGTRLAARAHPSPCAHTPSGPAPALATPKQRSHATLVGARSWLQQHGVRAGRAGRLVGWLAGRALQPGPHSMPHAQPPLDTPSPLSHTALA